jgi:DNA polymerase-1|tara:strand:+ start:2345 stop:3985 length:1641 start_codon:yes stop_codon:yes gene_type:complete
MTIAVVDIETNGLKNEATKIHCIVAKEYTTGKIKTWVQDECKEFGKWSKLVDTFIMHNGLSFDAPLLNKFTNSSIQSNQIRDTLLESQLFNPIRDKGHSLRAWGEKLNFSKGEVESFDDYTPDMLTYCIQDVELTFKVAKYLEKESKNFSKQSVILENKIRIILDQQEENGFTLNLRKASELMATLQDEADTLVEKAQKLFPDTEVQLKTKVKYIPFNIGSRKQIAERLMERGWEPKLKTDKGNVIVNEEVLKTIKLPEAKMFSRYLLLQKRVAQIKSWIILCDKDNKVHGKVMTLRTITGRMAHNSPNMAQVPAVYSPYGKECRDCWTVSDLTKYSLVGTDASGLELRCLAHYMNDTKFTNELLTGDIHTANMKMAGLTNRDQAKTFIYAFLYGAGAAKIGKIVGGGAKKGQQLIDRFLSNMPALNALRTKVQRASQNGIIRGLDGRLLHIRSTHSALNTLIQGAGAVVCKHWLLEIMSSIKMTRIDAKLVASIHDEYQFEVNNKDINTFGQITKEAMKKTQQVLKLNCELDSEWKMGETWASTH